MRINDIFNNLAASGQTALMPFLTAGYPSLEVTEQLLPELAAAGASVVELGIPFSDPIADGPVIAASMHAALAGGVTLAAVLDMVRRVRPTVEIGLVAMVSASIVQRIGPERFLADAAAAGLDGLIIPDIDPAAAAATSRIADEHGLSFSLLVAPTTSPERVAGITSCCRGFVYLLARGGLTGERTDLAPIAEPVAAVRATTSLPIAVGFGISSPEQVAAVTEHADAAIVGSAIVRRLAAPAPVAEVSRFVAELAAGLATRRH